MSQFATTRGYIRSWICKVGALAMIYPNKVEAKHWYLNYSNQHGREPRLHHCAWIFGLNWEPKKAQSWRPTSPMAREHIGSPWLRTPHPFHQKTARNHGRCSEMTLNGFYIVLYHSRCSEITKVPKNSQEPNYTCLGSIFGTFNGNNGMNGSIPTGERNTDLVQDLLRR